jgi:hypothetical protein
LVVELSIKNWLAGILVVGLLVACNSDKATQRTNDAEGIDVQWAMEQAVDQLLALESASFNLEHLEGATELFPGVLMTRAFGEVLIPDRFRVTVEAESRFPKSYIEISIITIDDTSYMTGIISRRWSEVPTDSLPFNLSGLGQTLADIVAAVQVPRALRAERLNGVDTLHIKGEIASEDLSGLVPGAGEGFSVGLDLWLEQDGLLRQVHIVGRVIPTDDLNTVRRLTLNDINQPVTINPPG